MSADILSAEWSYIFKKFKLAWKIASFYFALISLRSIFIILFIFYSNFNILNKYVF